MTSQEIRTGVLVLVSCKFGNFRENFIFAKSVITDICGGENSRQGRDLPISVNYRVISPIREEFICTKLRICEVSRKKDPRENFWIYTLNIAGMGLINSHDYVLVPIHPDALA